ncbi:unnamed protein product, partial [Discosporangium mesarthrocarpum]
KQIGCSVGASSSIFVKSGATIFDDGAVSTTIVSPCILEYRKKVGEIRNYKKRTRSWNGGYLMSYASVGLERSIMEWLKYKFSEPSAGASGTIDWKPGGSSGFKSSEGH